MKNCCSCGSTFATALSYLITSVVGLGAISFVACERNGASVDVVVLANLMIRLPVQAPSSAVSGLPSDHFPPGFRWNVHVRPSFDVVQSLAQSPWTLNCVLYYTSVGYMFVKTMYE